MAILDTVQSPNCGWDWGKDPFLSVADFRTTCFGAFFFTTFSAAIFVLLVWWIFFLGGPTDSPFIFIVTKFRGVEISRTPLPSFSWLLPVGCIVGSFFSLLAAKCFWTERRALVSVRRLARLLVAESNYERIRPVLQRIMNIDKKPRKGIAPSPWALAVLIKGMEVMENHREPFRQALVAYTGQDFACDYTVWKKWLAGFPLSKEEGLLPRLFESPLAVIRQAEHKHG